jgi:oligopeptide/dipeptide ABC transporter ATP-binding protein
MLLQTQDLCVEFGSTPVVRAVDGVTLDIHPQEIVGLVGESGSGKTVFSLSVLRLIGKAGRIRRGRILWQGRDLLGCGEEDMRRVRGSEIAMIFQNPQASLNPVRTIGTQISSVIRLHQKCAPATARQESLRWLEAVRIADPIRVYEAYPHQCSGGMCQRILIAMALACRPQLLIADEPTASLDVTIQAQIMDLLLEVREKYGTAILLVSHDLGVIARMCDRIAVMYCGRIVELAEAHDLYSKPQHPYTRLLLQSVPVPDPSHRPPKVAQSNDFVGFDAGNPSGCPFRPRCVEAESECGTTEPRLVRISQNGHHVACLPRQREAEHHRENWRSDDDEAETNSGTSPIAGEKGMILGSV